MVTISRIISQLEDQRKRDADYFRRAINEGKMLHYTRDAKLAVWDAIIERCKQAKKEKILLKDALKDLSP